MQTSSDQPGLAEEGMKWKADVKEPELHALQEKYWPPGSTALRFAGQLWSLYALLRLENTANPFCTTMKHKSCPGCSPSSRLRGEQEEGPGLASLPSPEAWYMPDDPLESHCWEDLRALRNKGMREEWNVKY